MSTVVQATCPGCRKVLRIPADWLSQTFRCVHCRTVVQAQRNGRPFPSTPANGASAKASPAIQTAPPPERKARPAVPVAAPVAAPPPFPLTRPSPPAAGGEGRVRGAPPALPIASMAIPAPLVAGAPPTAPLAPPAIAGPVAESGSVFAGFDEPDAEGSPRR